MPLPVTAEQFVALVRKSNLADAERLDALLQGGTAAGAEPAPAELARRLVDAGLLTNFQSEQLLQGKWRGFTIGKFKVLERLGSGGMGSVYLCEHMTMRHKVAVKVLPIAKAQDPAALGRFYREARAAGVLDHPNLVRAHDIDQEGELHYLVMDYVDGVNLQRLVMKTTGPLPVDRACHYTYQAAHGLDHAFKAGLVHRDIKPANVLIDRTGTVKILDLGLARFFDDNQDLLTLKYDDNNVLGTADYVSPEQAHDSHDVDIRTDIYSLGATFYFMLTGQPLFPEGKVAQKLIWHQTRQPAPVRKLRPDVPEALEAVLGRMLVKRREERYQAPVDVIAALAPWVRTPVAPPADHEIPEVSPAARAAPAELAARTPSPAPRPGRPASRSDARAGAAPAGRRPAAPVATGGSDPGSPTPRGAPAGAGTGADHATPRVLASEVPTARNPDARTALVPPTAQGADAPRSGGRTPEQLRERRLTRIAIITLALMAGSSTGLALRLSLRGAAPAPGPREAAVLVVDRSGAEGTFATVRDALRQARPGDRIQVREAAWQECLRLDSGGDLGEGVVLEGAAPGGTVVWSAPDGQKEGQSLLHLSAVAGLRVRNFTLDGRELVRHLVTLSGPCPGLTLEDVRLRGFRSSAVHLTNCTGDAEAPVLLRRLHAAPARESEAGVLLEAYPDQACRHVRVADCRLDGPCQAGVAVAGPVADVELSGNRFARLADGVLCRRSVPACPVRLTLAGNVFRDVQRAALRFEKLPVEGSRIVLRDNRFVRTAALGQTDGFRPEPPRPSGCPAAAWVWALEPSEKCYLRKTFRLESAPTRAVLSITAADGCTAWLNGQRVGQGHFDPASRRVQAFDVARYLQRGENVLAVEASGRPMGPAGLLAELSDNGAGASTRTLASDATWKASGRPAPGWQGRAFDDGAWPAARVVAEYGQGEPSWRDPVWEAVVQEHFQYRAWEVFPAPTGNQRDDRSREGFPSFDAAVVPGLRAD